MTMIEKEKDFENRFLSRRELILTFNGLGGKLKKLDAIDMVSKEFNLNGKIIIPINMKNHTGKPSITGTFYVYEDEKIAKQHVNPIIFERLNKAKKKLEESQSKAAEEKKEEQPVEKKEEKSAEEKPPEKKEEKQTKTPDATKSENKETPKPEEKTK